jgi:tetratricopeptide (TPR) repeat protein
VSRIPSWDGVPGEAGLHPPDLRVDPLDANEAIRQLVELGYMPAPSDEQNDAIEIARREWKFNLAASKFDANRATEALPIIEQLCHDYPGNSRFALLLAQCYANLNRAADVRRVVESLNAAARGPSTPEADLWLGWALLVSGEHTASAERLRLAERSTPNSPVVHSMIGRVYCQQRRWADAERAFARALEIDPESEIAHDGMASVMLGTARDEQAAVHALRAVGLLHDFPIAHYHLGVALVHLGRYERAAIAMSVAVSMAPGMLHAHRYLVALYMRLNNPERAMAHRKIARRLWDAKNTGAVAGTPEELQSVVPPGRRA